MVSSVDKEKREYAQRLFKCLSVSIRPLRVEGIFAAQFDTTAATSINEDLRPQESKLFDEEIREQYSPSRTILAFLHQGVLDFGLWSELSDSRRLKMTKLTKIPLVTFPSPRMPRGTGSTMPSL